MLARTHIVSSLLESVSEQKSQTAAATTTDAPNTSPSSTSAETPASRTPTPAAAAFDLTDANEVKCGSFVLSHVLHGAPPRTMYRVVRSATRSLRQNSLVLGKDKDGNCPPSSRPRCPPRRRRSVLALDSRSLSLLSLFCSAFLISSFFYVCAS
jgi:hypothetical protein